MNNSSAVVREQYQVVARQWLPQSMVWQEVVAGSFATFDQAHKRAVELMGYPGIDAFVRNAPILALDSEGSGR